jgi:hypothetical protein
MSAFLFVSAVWFKMVTLGISIIAIPTRGNDTDRCLKVKKVTIVEIGVKSTVNEVVLGVTTGKGWVPDNG